MSSSDAVRGSVFIIFSSFHPNSIRPAMGGKAMFAQAINYSIFVSMGNVAIYSANCVMPSAYAEGEAVSETSRT